MPKNHDLELNHQYLSPGNRKLVLILPSDQSNHDLCKVISSAVALGYPAPVIVNWKKDFHTDKEGVGASQLAKITGTLNFLKWATSTSATEVDKLDEDDLILMLDAFDVWLQLPPSVLLQRYFKANERANNRVRREHGTISNDSVQQTIIVSAQKRCYSPRDSISNYHCNAVPESALPRDVYGFLTDLLPKQWAYKRPRYLNSGSFMGPVGDMRRYFERVKERMDYDLLHLGPDKELGGDQGVFAEIFGEQEMWRKSMHESYLLKRKQGRLPMSDEFEYHIGLDYTQELFYPTCYSENDGYFVSLDNDEAVMQESKRLGLWFQRTRGVPTDIEAAESPLGKITDKNVTWGEVPLYTDLWTTSIPVALHHNAWKDGLKSRRVTWWNKTWYFPYLRRLLQENLQPSETTPLATLKARNDSLQIWPYDARRTRRAPLLFGKNTESKDWMLRETEWAAVCSNDETAEAEGHWYNEVFRDGLGPF
ncbi:hypothetical protein G7046_g3892 [Stylonectria norvegica]|nr:hypothetical protein G7046_g3892 [Stylonectria norvegica]